MAYEFGTNWSGFSNVAGNVTGPLLTYEVLTAFFLEAGFLGVMLFGWQRVSPRAHFFATLMVALGTLISTFWILASNSFMQTPQGYAIENGRIVPVDWLKIIFNPSFPYRLAHMTIAAFIVAGFIVAACGAWHLLHGRRDKPVKPAASRWRCGFCCCSRRFRFSSAMRTVSTHAISTGKDRGDRRAMGDGKGRNGAEPGRPAGHERGSNAIHDPDTASGQPDPDP